MNYCLFGTARENFTASLPKGAKQLVKNELGRAKMKKVLTLFLIALIVETLTATIGASAGWNLNETWSGVVEAPAEWKLIETWSGAIESPVEWQLIEEWMGTVSAPAVWGLIESWTGAVEAPAAWQLIETWTGTIEAPVVWKLIETWAGTVEAPAVWRLIETWMGTVKAPVAWQLVETWAGTVESPAEWHLTETWTGTVEAPVEWKLIETWTGTIQAPVAWQIIETWSGIVQAPAAWQFIETWTGTVQATAAWWPIETWAGTVRAPAVWQFIESWTGTVTAPVAWQIIETWTGTVRAPAQWLLIETWVGTVEAPAAWQLVEAWIGTVEAPAEWKLIETWTGTVETLVEWKLIEIWSGTIQAPVAWQIIETWTGTVQAPVEWQIVEAWTGTVGAPAGWNLIETWTGVIEAPAEWWLIETWAGTVEAPVGWQLIETWTGTVGAPVEWQLIETWTGTVSAPAEWKLIETWTGTISAPAAWQLIETWTGTVQAPAAWQLVETWTGTIDAPAAWQLIETWTGTVNAPVVRAVDVSISPDWQENIAGGSLSYEVVVTNLGEVADDLNLSVSDTLGWGLSLDNTRFEDIENGGSRGTTLRVTISGAAVPCQTDNITVTATSGGDPSKSDGENCQAHVALPRDVEVEISPSWQEGSPGETLLYVVTVKNTGHLNDKYNLTASDSLGWALISLTELWIENGDNDIASLSVTIPLETVGSITDVVTVHAEGTLAEGTSTDPENVSAENTAEARCTVVRDVDVSISPSYQSGLPGTLLTYNVTITNTGNALDTYELTTSDNAGWFPVVSPASIGLSPSASGNATLRVIVALDAISSTQDNMIVTATSQLDDTVSSSASSIAHAVTITDHDPIHILGNDDFTQANGVISGSGTLEDPYIIGYWDIDASSAHGIWIENTDVHFIIRNCRVHDGGFDYNYGVYFDRVKNGKIESVTSYNNDVGIYLKNSSNNIISKSNASGNVNGIYLQSSPNNDIEKCTASSNFTHGIYLNSSDNIIISESNASNNTNGIFLQSSSNNRIEKCTASNNDLHGIYVGSSSENSRIHHNSFKNNLYQAWDECSNRWDDGYPSGGNYWSDYTGTDNYRGENQDIPGNDGIGDTPYYILGDNNLDSYPLITRSFELPISPGYQSGLPGTELSYTVTLTNTGNIVDNYSLTVSDNAGWGPIITPSSLSVYPSQSKNAILEVTIPGNAENSDRDNILVVARSQTDDTVSASAGCIAHAEIIRRVEVSISPEENGELARENVTFTVMVTNIGNIVDNYDLAVIDNLGWGPALSENSLGNVQPSEDRTVTLSVTIPENAEPCTKDNTIVIAVSRTDPGVSDNDSCIAHVFSPKAEFSLATLYEVNLDVNLWLESGSKLVVKFYTWGDDFQAENVVWSGTAPDHVVLLEDIPHPQGKALEKVRLVLTTDDTENVIATIASFTVCKDDLRTRYRAIPKEWGLEPTQAGKDKLRNEYRKIPGHWGLSPC